MDDDEDLVDLRSVPDTLLGSSSGARSSGADGPPGIEAEESSIRKRAAPSPLRGPSLKHPCAAADDGQGTLHVAPISPSPPGSEALGVVVSDYHPSLEIPKGEDPDLI